MHSRYEIYLRGGFESSTKGKRKSDELAASSKANSGRCMPRSNLEDVPNLLKVRGGVHTHCVQTGEQPNGSCRNPRAAEVPNLLKVRGGLAS